MITKKYLFMPLITFFSLHAATYDDLCREIEETNTKETISITPEMTLFVSKVFKEIDKNYKGPRNQHKKGPRPNCCYHCINTFLFLKNGDLTSMNLQDFMVSKKNHTIENDTHSLKLTDLSEAYCINNCQSFKKDAYTTIGVNELMHHIRNVHVRQLRHKELHIPVKNRKKPKQKKSITSKPERLFPVTDALS